MSLLYKTHRLTRQRYLCSYCTCLIVTYAISGTLEQHLVMSALFTNRLQTVKISLHNPECRITAHCIKYYQYCLLIITMRKCRANPAN